MNYYKKAEEYFLGKDLDLGLEKKEDPIFNDLTLEQAKKQLFSIEEAQAKLSTVFSKIEQD